MHQFTPSVMYLFAPWLGLLERHTLDYPRSKQEIYRLKWIAVRRDAHARKGIQIRIPCRNVLPYKFVEEMPSEAPPEPACPSILWRVQFVPHSGALRFHVRDLGLMIGLLGRCHWNHCWNHIQPKCSLRQVQLQDGERRARTKHQMEAKKTSQNRHTNFTQSHEEL